MLHLNWNADETGLLTQSAGGDGFLMWMVLRALHFNGSGFFWNAGFYLNAKDAMFFAKCAKMLCVSGFGTQIEEIEVIFKI